MASSRDYTGADGLRHLVFPFVPAPGGIEPRAPVESITFTQRTPSTTWTIVHDLGYNPSVAIMVNDQEVDADVDYPNIETVVVRFNTAQKGIARLT